MTRMTKERQQAIRDEREAEKRYTQQGYQQAHEHLLLHEILKKLDRIIGQQRHQHNLEHQILEALAELKPETPPTVTIRLGNPVDKPQPPQE